MTRKKGVLNMEISKEGKIQLTCNDSNWHLYIDSNNYIWAIAIKEGALSSHYGSIKHLVSIIYKYKGYKIEDFTKEGLEILKNYLTSIGYTLDDLFQSKYIPTYRILCK